MNRRDELVRRYDEAPIVKGLAELRPGGGALNALMAHRVGEIDRERAAATQETIASEDCLNRPEGF